MAHYSWVVPNPIMAGVVKHHALEGLRDNVAALVKRIRPNGRVSRRFCRNSWRRLGPPSAADQRSEAVSMVGANGIVAAERQASLASPNSLKRQRPALVCAGRAGLRIESSTTELRWRALNLARPPAPCYRPAARTWVGARSSIAFTVTVSVLALIASAAHAGLSRMPNEGYNAPAASGIAIKL